MSADFLLERCLKEAFEVNEEGVLDRIKEEYGWLFRPVPSLLAHPSFWCSNFRVPSFLPRFQRPSSFEDFQAYHGYRNETACN